MRFGNDIFIVVLGDIMLRRLKANKNMEGGPSTISKNFRASGLQKKEFHF